MRTIKTILSRCRTNDEPKALGGWGTGRRVISITGLQLVGALTIGHKQGTCMLNTCKMFTTTFKF